MSTSNLLDGAIRVSNLNGRVVSADSTMTIGDQQRKLHEAAAAVGKKVGKVFELLDESGFTSAGGDTMQEMLARCERGENCGVVFAYQSRNGRNWWEQGPFFSRLQDANGLYVIRGLESIDYRTPVGRQVFGMQAVQDEGVYWTAKQNGDNTVERMVSEKVYNRVPYGYQRNGTFMDGVCVAKVNAERNAKALTKTDTAPVVLRIFTLRDTDHAVGAIVRILNDEGIPGPRGGRWTKTTIVAILANPIYKGLVEYGHRNPKRKAGVAATVRSFQDPELEIVSPALWKRVQGKRVKLQRTGSYKAGVAGGVLVCGSCGRTMQVIGSGDGRRHYGCTRDDSKGEPCPRPVTVKKDAADEYVDAAVERIMDALSPVKAVADVRRLDTAEAAVKRAQENLDALDEIEPTHRKFAEWVTQRTTVLEAAEDELELAKAEADAARDLPKDALDYRSRSLIARNVAARALLRVEVAPPLSRSRFADITERFTLTER